VCWVGVLPLMSVGAGEYVSDITEGVVEESGSVVGTVIGRDLGRGDTQAGVERLGVFPESGSVFDTATPDRPENVPRHERAPTPN